MAHLLSPHPPLLIYLIIGTKYAQLWSINHYLHGPIYYESLLRFIHEYTCSLYTNESKTGLKNPHG